VVGWCRESVYMASPRPILVLALAASVAGAQPATSPYPVSGDDDTVSIAAAAFSGWYAAADAYENLVEVRDARDGLLRTITAAEIVALAPWLALDGGPDGPSALAWSASGRLLFIGVHDDTLPGDGLGSDVILRYDASADALSLFARLDLFDRGDTFPHLAMAHHRGRLYASTVGAGVRVYSAFAHTTSPSLLATLTPGGATTVRGLAVDREADRLYLSSDTAVYRASLAGFPPTAFTAIASVAGTRALAWGEVYAGPGQRGLYVLRPGAGGQGSSVEFIAAALAGGVTSPVTPTAYLATPAVWHDVAATAEGSLLAAADDDAVRITDGADLSLPLDAWMADEFGQVVNFAKGLMVPDCGLSGLVIDADTEPGRARFHPASPDAAGWTVLLLIANDRVFGDANALPLARQILSRHAGTAPGPGVLRSSDGIYIHWINPCTGGPATGGCACVPGDWGTEYATLSTMKIVGAAARAMSYWPDDAEVVRAASRIIFRTRNWDSYIQAGSDGLYFAGAAGGGPIGGASAPFQEGIIFVEQAGEYGSDSSRSAYARWINRSLWPTAAYLFDRPLTSNEAGRFHAAFVSLYPALLTRAYRADASWRGQVENLRWSSAAWTDDMGPRFSTVFSAGTSNPAWAGRSYQADNLGTHPGNVATFPSLMGLCAVTGTPEAVAAYHAYRKGGRQTFRGGESILYRRSDTDRAYLPDSAGLPDVALGALGLGEVMSPGYLDEVLARPYPLVEQCPVDVNGDGVVTVDDAYALAASPQDVNGDGVANGADVRGVAGWVRRREIGRRDW
jgi:hypothetical protein